MIPIVPIIFIASRLMSQSQNAQNARGTSQEIQITWRSACLWFVLVPAWIGLAAVLVGAPKAHWAWVGVLVMLTGVLFPRAVARWVCVPLGLPHLAHRLSTARFTRARLDPGEAGFLAARALAQRPSPCRQQIDELERIVQSAGSPLRAGHAAALGALAGLRGDGERARQLLSEVSYFAPDSGPRHVRTRAVEWVVVEAARRADWTAVRELASGPTATWATRWLRRVADEQLGERRRGHDFFLALTLLLGRFRWQRTVLWRRILKMRRMAKVATKDGNLDLGAKAGPLASALSLHLRYLAPEAGATWADLNSLARRWDDAFDSPELTRQVLERAHSLGGTDAQAALRRLRIAVDTDIGELSAKAQGPARLEANSSLLRALSLELDERLSALDELVERYASRLESDRILSGADELSDWSALRKAYEQVVALGGAAARQQAYAIVRGPLERHAVHLFNVAKERPLANALFRWLARQSAHAGDEPARTIYEKNLKCSINVHEPA